MKKLICLLIHQIIAENILVIKLHCYRLFNKDYYFIIIFIQRLHFKNKASQCFNNTRIKPIMLTIIHGLDSINMNSFRHNREKQDEQSRAKLIEKVISEK